MSTLRFGLLIEQPPDEARGPPRRNRRGHPTNVVAGCRATSRPKAASSSSNGGNPGASGSVRGPRRPEVPVRVGVELLPALVSCVEWLEERDRVGDVDDDRQVELGGGAQSGSSRGSSTATSRPPGSRARSPSSFQTLRPRAPRAAESRSRAASVSPNAGSVSPAVVVEAGKDRDAIRIGRLPALDLVRERVALATVEVDDHLDAGRVERRDQLRRSARRPVATERRTEMVVGVDDRDTSAAEPREPGRGATTAAGSRRGGGRRRSFRTEDDDLAEMPRRVGIAATCQGQVERQRRGPGGAAAAGAPRMQAAADQAHLAGRAAGFVLVARDQPRRGPEARRLRDDRGLLGGAGPADQPDDEHARLAYARSGRGGTRAARRRSPGTWLVSVNLRPHSAAIPIAGPPPRTTIRLQSVAPSRRPTSAADVASLQRSGSAAKIRGEPLVAADDRNDTEEQGEHAGERAGHDDRRFVAGRRDERDVGQCRERAVRPARHRDRRVTGRAHPLGDADGLRRGPGTRDDHDGFAAGQSTRVRTATSTPLGRRISSESGAAMTGRRSHARRAAAATAWAR